MSIKDIENIYPLSPLQESLLFGSHPVEACRQLTCTLVGNLDTGLFARALRRVVDDNPVLRTSFAWKRVDKPLQLVHKHFELPLKQVDLRGLSPDRQEDQLQQYRRAEGFDPSNAPLFNLTLCRLDEDRYRLIWSYHELILDRTSLLLILEELFYVYDALGAGKQLSAEPRRQFKDYVAWLRQQDSAESEAFWQRELQGVVAPTRLPMQQTSGGGDDFAEHVVKISQTTATDLRQLTREHDVSQSTILSAAWALLLSRYTDERDIIIGIAVSNRPAELSGSDRIAGQLTNVAPARIQIPSTGSLVALLDCIKDKQTQLHEHGFLSPQQVQSYSNASIEGELFESLLVFDDLAPNLFASNRARTPEVKDIEFHEHSGLPITVIAALGAELSIKISYDSRRFDSDFIERMAGHYVTLLDAIATNPAQPISDLSLLSIDERHLLLEEFNRTSRPFPSDLPIHELFQQQARLNPDAVAVASREGRLSYDELNRRANQLGHYLRKQGVGRGVVVGILMGRGIEQIISVLGVMKAGGAYVPLDGSYPMSRLAYMLEDAEVSVLITTGEMEERMPAYWGRVVRVEEESEEIGGEREEEVESGVGGRDLAYVIYTSGSTGMPKGVMVEHSGLVNLAEAQISTFGMSRGDQVLQFASFSFDASIFEIIMALRAGATLHVASQEKLLPGPELLRLLKENAITNITIPPSVLAMLPEEELLDLKTVNVAGEACPADLVSRWGKGRRFFNLYGPTEATVWATAARCLDGGSKPTIGRAIPNAKTYLLDSQMRPVPVGLPGELHIGGAGVARGYFHRPELTAERFVPDPFSSEPGSRLYKTGDLARYLPSGDIDFLGRVDHQVKMRGFRIEPGEVEAVLSQHIDVGEAIVIIKEGAGGEKRLIAYVTSRPDHPPDIKEMTGLLKERLPDYMIPSDIVILDAFPLTPNGKLDRKALPEPSRLRPELDELFVPPQTELEQTIASIWQEVLSLERVGTQENFFDLGGHSLLMVQVQSKLQILLNRDIAIIDLFGNPTIKLLAKYFAEQEDHQPTPEKENDLPDKLSAGKDRLKQMLRQRQAEVI